MRNAIIFLVILLTSCTSDDFYVMYNDSLAEKEIYLASIKVKMSFYTQNKPIAFNAEVEDWNKF